MANTAQMSGANTVVLTEPNANQSMTVSLSEGQNVVLDFNPAEVESMELNDDGNLVIVFQNQTSLIVENAEYLFNDGNTAQIAFANGQGVDTFGLASSQSLTDIEPAAGADVTVKNATDGFSIDVPLDPAPLVEVVAPEPDAQAVLELAPGEEYQFVFGQDQLQSVEQQGEQLVITFENGGVLVIPNYGSLVVEDETALLLNEGGTPFSAAEAQQFLALAQQLDQIEPAAGAPGAGGGASNTGFGFGSQFVAQLLETLDAIGTIIRTALEYTAPEPETDEGAEETSVNFTPQMVLPEGLTVDESDFNGSTVLTVSGQIVANYFGEGPGAVTATGAPSFSSTTTDLTSGGEPITVSLTGNTYTGTANGTTVFEITIEADGSFTFNQYENIDHPDATDPNDTIGLEFGVTATDADGDTSTSQITINVNDDGPEANDDNNSFDSEVTAVATGNVVTGENGGPDAADTLSTDGQNTVTEVTFNGTSFAVPETGNVTINGQYGALEISADGSYTYTLFTSAIENEDGAIQDDFTYTLTDFDGDSDDAVLSLQTTIIPNDIPEIIATDKLSVDETDFGSGTLTASGQVVADYFNDGPGTITATGEGSFSSSATLTSGGAAVTVALVGNTYVGTANGTTVFELTVEADGQYSFEQYENLDHPDETDSNDTITLEFGVTATDADGDTDTGHVTVKVYDDGPIASDDLNSFDSEASLTTTGNVITGENGGPGAADTLSTDGQNTVTEVAFNGTSVDVPETGNVTINGQYGALEIATDGSYSYTLFDATMKNEDGAIHDDFTYTLTDFDGDGDDAVLRLETSILENDIPKIIATDKLSVDETDFDSGTLTASGQVIADYFNDGPGTITATGEGNFSSSTSLTAGGVAVTVALVGNTYVGTANGTTVFELTVEADGQYSFEQYENLDHPDDMDPNDTITLQFGVTATDADGDTDTGHVTVKVYDDGPVASDDFNQYDGEVATGNVITGENGGPGAADDLSTDGPNAVTKIAFGATSVDVPETGTASIDGQYGTLVIEADGSYTYTLHDGVTDGVTETTSLNPNASDVSGYQTAFSKNGMTISNVTPGGASGDLTWVNNYGSGIGIAGNTSDKVWQPGEMLNVSLDAASDKVVVTLADIGANNLQAGIDFNVYVDGVATPVSYEFDVATTTPVNERIEITLDAADFGGQITGFDVYSVQNSSLKAASFLLNDVTAETTTAGDIKDNFTYTLTDYDGDSDEATLCLETEIVPNDIPKITATDKLSVDETDFGSGTLTASGQVVADYFNDGPGTITATGEGSFTSSTSLTAGGVAVTVELVGNTYVGTANGTTIFDLTIETNGQYSFNQYENLDHPDETDSNDAITLQFGVTATDADGDTDTGHVTVKVYDDGPIASDDLNSFDSEASLTTTGNVITGENGGPGAADTLSTDGQNTVTEVAFNGTSVDVPETGNVTINGQYGVLEIAADGSYSYTLFDATMKNEDGAIQDDFTYTLTDFDGDGDDAVLSLQTSIEANDIPKIIAVDKLTVDETDFGSGTLTASGQVVADYFNDGPGTITATGEGSFSSSTSLTAGGVAVTVALVGNTYVGTANGTTVFELTVEADGQYSFEQYENLDHPDETDSNDVIAMQFGVTATDADGDTDTGHVTVKVYDDGPVASDDFNHYDGEVATGNVITGENGGPDAADDLSTDAPNAVTKIAFGATSVDVPETGTASIDGEYGTLVIEADGSYTYTLHDGVTDGVTTVQEHEFDGGIDFPILAERIEYENSEALGVLDSDLSVGYETTAKVTFVSEGAGYSNSFGSYVIDPAIGEMKSADMMFTNGNDLPVGSSQNMDVPAGSQMGFFIIADGHSLNHGYPGIDFSDGELAFVNKVTGNPATIHDNSGDISLVFTDSAGHETVLKGPTYHTTSRGGDTDLNPDGKVHVVSGAPEDGSTDTLRIGFEDLPKLGDTDYNDFIFDVKVNPSTVVEGGDVKDNFTYTLTDADGDSDEATLCLKTTIDPNSEPEIIAVDKLVVDETDLGAGLVTVSGEVTADFFNDGPGGFAATGAGSFNASGSMTNGNLTSAGVAVVVALVGNTYTATADGTKVFDLTIEDDGQYSFNLYETLDHADQNDPNDVISLSFGVTASDVDGDTAETHIKVDVLDDAVVANNDLNVFNGFATDGDVLTGENGGPGAEDVLSQDTPNLVTQVSFGDMTVDIPETGTAKIDGKYGYLQMSADGDYEYIITDPGGSHMVRQFNVTNPGHNDNGGKIHEFDVSYNELDNNFKMKVVLSDIGWNTTNGFTVALGDTDNPRGTTGETAMLYFDASGSDPVVTIYGNNGSYGQTSYKDGSNAWGTQAPDQIASSLVDTDMFDYIKVTENDDGTKTLEFSMDATKVINHDPMYGDSSDWTGVTFDDLIGVSLNPVSDLETKYDDGYLTKWNYCATGSYDVACKAVDCVTVKGDEPVDIFEYQVTDGDGDTSSAYLVINRDVYAEDNVYVGQDGQVDSFAVNADGGVDLIVGYNEAEGDTVDISQVLSGYDPLADALSDFVKVDVVNDNTEIKVNMTGTSGGSFETVAVLHNVAGIDLDNLVTDNSVV